MKFIDGLQSLISGLANRRNSLNTNTFSKEPKLSDDQLRALYNSGIGSKIVRLKGGQAMEDTVQLSSKSDLDKYDNYLSKHAKAAAKMMIGFGRAISVIIAEGEIDISKPLDLSKVNILTTDIKTFSGDMVSVSSYESNLLSKRYYKPKEYVVRGYTIHHSRVIDWTYFEPSEYDKPEYRYGGVSEFQLIYPQLIADGIVQRATPSMLEKSSTLFYRVANLKDALRQGKESDLLQYFSTLETSRSIYGAGIVDKDDEVDVVTQNLANLSETDMITLRRLAMVTGIPLSVFVGEAVKGMNATGENEMKIYQDMLETLQSDYLLEPLRELCGLFGITDVHFKENQGETPLMLVKYESDVLDNALKLYNMQEDYRAYLEDKGVVMKDDFANLFD